MDMKINLHKFVVVIHKISHVILFSFVVFFCLPYSPAIATEYFNPNALEVGVNDSIADINTVVQNDYQLPGIYKVDIFVNNNYFDRRDISFVIKNNKLTPELDSQILSEMGVIPPKGFDLNSKSLFDAYPDIRFYFSSGTQKLNMQIPQIMIRKEARNFVEPSTWQQGIPAAIANYSYAGSQNRNFSGNSNYVNLRSGLNFDEWRFRNYSTWAMQTHKASTWDNVYNYIQRDIQVLKGQLIVGDGTSPGDITESIPFRGVQITSDDNQLPDSLRGFAPIIRGIAKSSAQVTIQQNGYIIYQTYVAPGPFEINDLFPTNSQGDLTITIKESDGSERSFIQPFSAVPIMQREGRLKYGVTLGRYRSQSNSANEPDFGSLSLVYGVSNSTTLYTSTNLSNDYRAGTLGGGVNLNKWGAVSLDVTNAQTTLYNGSNKNGQSYRLQYSKSFVETGTSLSFAGYEYSSNGYYDFIDSNELFFQQKNNNYPAENKRNRIQISINQNLGNYGGLYLFAYQQDYWNNARKDLNVNSGYAANYLGISWIFNYAWSKYNDANDSEQQFSLTLQVPLSILSSTALANYNLISDAQGRSRQLIGISDTVLDDNNLSYSINQGYDSYTSNGIGNASLAYKGTYNELRAGYNYNNDNKQLNYGAAGGIIIHPYGVTFSQPLGDTIALVRVPGAYNVKIENRTGVYTDWRGYAVIPNVSTYRKNRIALNTQTLPDKIDIDEKVQTVIPTQGAVVLANFSTRIGAKVLMTLTHNDKFVPFGAVATLENDQAVTESTSIVSTNGILYMNGMPAEGVIKVRWGSRADQQCMVKFTLPGYAEQLLPSVLIMSEKCS